MRLMLQVVYVCMYPLQISDSFKKFGIKDLSENVLIAILHNTRESLQVWL